MVYNNGVNIVVAPHTPIRKEDVYGKCIQTAIRQLAYQSFHWTGREWKEEDEIIYCSDEVAM